MDLVEAVVKPSAKDDDDSIIPWIWPIHLDDEKGNLDPRITGHAREFGSDVDRVLVEEVGTSSSSAIYSFKVAMRTPE